MFQEIMNTGLAASVSTLSTSIYFLGEKRSKSARRYANLIHFRELRRHKVSQSYKYFLKNWIVAASISFSSFVLELSDTNRRG